MPSTVLMVSDFIQASAHGSSAAAKVSSSLYSHQGSGEINYNPQNRWYLPDGIEVTAQAFDTIFINGRQSNSSSIIPMQQIDRKLLLLIPRQQGKDPDLLFVLIFVVIVTSPYCLTH